MANFVNNDVFDTALNYIKNNCTHIVLLPSVIENYADIASNELGRANAPTLTLGNGSVANSRKLEFDDTNVTISKNGDLSYIGFIDTTNSKVLAVSEIFLSKTVESGATYKILKDSIEISL